MVAPPPQACLEGFPGYCSGRAWNQQLKFISRFCSQSPPRAPATPWLELCTTKVSVPYLINQAELSSLSPADGFSLPINYPVHFFFFPSVMLSFQQPNSSPPFVTFIAALSETQSCRHSINPAQLLGLFATCCSSGEGSSRVQDLH